MSRLIAVVFVLATAIGCAGAPKQITAEQFRDLLTRPVATIQDAQYLGYTQAAEPDDARVYLESWQHRPVLPNRVVYFTPLSEFESAEIDRVRRGEPPIRTGEAE